MPSWTTKIITLPFIGPTSHRLTRTEQTEWRSYGSGKKLLHITLNGG